MIVFGALATSSSPCLIVILIDIFGIGPVEHEKHFFRQRRTQSAQLLRGQICAGRVVRIGDKNSAGARCDPFKDRVNIRGQIALRRNDRFGSSRQDRDPVNEKTVLGINRLVAWPQIGLRENVKQFVRTIAADDMGWIQAMCGAKSFTQRSAGAIGITVKPGGRLSIRLDGARAWPKRRFV